MPDMRPLIARSFLGGCGVYLLLTACGGAKTPTSPQTPPTSGPTVTIGSSGLVPRTIEIPVGGRLTIVNNDTVSHDMGSDPHPSHEDCPELNQIGMLAPNQSRTSGNLVEARTCGMHDHLRPLVTSLQLRITIR
jgi:hypothetical protein